MNEIELKNAKCTALELSAPVSLARDDTGGFEIEAYTGAAVDRWWGKLAIDVSGISAKQQIPVFRGHDSDAIVGWSQKTWKDDSFRVAGKFSGSTEAAKEAKALAAEGFPWQASIGVRPVKIMQVEPDATHEVNGATLRGPAEVWIESEVFEVSFVPLGADDKTSIATFSKFTEPPQSDSQHNNTENEDEKMELTLEKLETDAPDLLTQIQESARADGAEAERNRIQAVLAQALPGHEKLAETLAFDGKTTGEAAAMAILGAEKELRKTKGDQFRADGVAPVAEPQVPETPKPAADPTTAEEFSKNKDLLEEFGDFETYAAFKQATEKGLVRILAGNKGA